MVVGGSELGSEVSPRETASLLPLQIIRNVVVLVWLLTRSPLGLAQETPEEEWNREAMKKENAVIGEF